MFTLKIIYCLIRWLAQGHEIIYLKMPTDVWYNQERVLRDVKRPARTGVEAVAGLFNGGGDKQPLAG